MVVIPASAASAARTRVVSPVSTSAVLSVSTFVTLVKFASAWVPTTPYEMMSVPVPPSIVSSLVKPVPVVPTLIVSSSEPASIESLPVAP